MCLCVCIDYLLYFIFFFFKQKTAYEMRISDWSSDVCSSDLSTVSRATANKYMLQHDHRVGCVEGLHGRRAACLKAEVLRQPVAGGVGHEQIGRASCRERVCQYV